MSTIYALYSTGDAAQRAVDALRKSSSEFRFDAGKIVVVSQEPIESWEFAERHTGVSMFALALMGGLIGAVAGYLLTSLTQRSYPLPTGGMPLVPPWTDGIIVYEMTMLGAILCTLVTLLVSTHLPTFRRAVTDPEIWNGKILVGVTDPPENSRRELETRLRAAGTTEIKTSP